MGYANKICHYSVRLFCTYNLLAFETVKREVTQLKHLFVLDLGEAIDNDEMYKMKVCSL